MMHQQFHCFAAAGRKVADCSPPCQSRLNVALWGKNCVDDGSCVGLHGMERPSTSSKPLKDAHTPNASFRSSQALPDPSVYGTSCQSSNGCLVQGQLHAALLRTAQRMGTKQCLSLHLQVLIQ